MKDILRKLWEMIEPLIVPGEHGFVSVSDIIYFIIN